LRARKKREKSKQYYCRDQNVKYMITEKSITLEIPEWINKVRVGTVPIILHQRRSSRQHEGATLRKNRCQAILCGFKTQKKIVKNPLQREPRVLELKWTSFTALT
jgi:hypothetical protein